MTSDVQHQKHFVVIAIGTALLVCGLVFTGRGYLSAHLQRLKLIPIPERFTELYFTSYPQVPQDLTRGKSLSFQFAIHNVQGQATQYTYLITLKASSGRSKVVDVGTVTLDNGEVRTINGSYAITESGLRGALAVELEEPRQEIRFLVSDTLAQ